MAEQKQTIPQAETKQPVSFQVMPRGGKFSYIEESLPPSAPPPAGGKTEQNATTVPAAPHKSSVVAYIIIAIIVLGILGFGAWYFLGIGKKNSSETQTTSSRLQKDWLAKYFQSETCDNNATCGDDADPDTDGLSNYKEFVAKTDPTLADTDSDGLADGDEVNIYNTQPTNQFTDARDVAKQNNYTDGSEIKNGYDPLTPGEKLTDTRIEQIKTNIQAYGLHEPTTTTLGNLTTTTNANQAAATFPNAKTWNVNILSNNVPTTVINKGDTVTWTNKDAAAHHLVSDNPLFESPDIAQGKTFSFQFTTVGIFDYHDTLNPTLKSTVTVK